MALIVAAALVVAKPCGFGPGSWNRILGNGGRP